MRILHVTHNFPRWDGDFSGSFLHSLSRQQIALGHEVLVLAPHAPDVATHEVKGQVQVHRFRYGSDAQETLAYTGTLHEIVRSSWKGRWRLIRFLHAERRATKALVRDAKPDVIHVHWWFPNGLAVWPQRPRGARCVTMTAHGTDVFLLRKLRFLRPLARAVLRSASAITAVSDLLADDVRELTARGVTVIPMPLDWELHGRDPVGHHERDADHLLFVGRLSAQKGAAILVQALAQLARAHPAIRLTIVGDGAERANLEQLVQSLGLVSRVGFVGTRSPAEVAALYRVASVLAVPATTGLLGEREGFGLVAVEAMLAGLPVVASASGGLVDIIEPGVTGLLVPVDDPAALAAAIARLLGDPLLRAAVADRARAAALHRFAPATLAQAYVSVYEDAMGDVARKRPTG